MKRFRCSVTDLMVVVLLSGYLMGCDTMGNPSPELSPWLLGSLSTAALGVLYRRGERRAFWAGFSIFGWCSLGLGALCLEPRHYLGSILAMTVLFAYIDGLVGRGFVAAGRRARGDVGALHVARGAPPPRPVRTPLPPA